MSSFVGQCTAAEYQKVLLILSEPALATTVCETFNVTAMGDTGAVLAYTLQQVYTCCCCASTGHEAFPACVRSSRAWPSQHNSFRCHTQLSAAKSQLSTSIQATNYGLNTAIILFGAFGVFIMQIGFAMFVAGVVRCGSAVRQSWNHQSVQICMRACMTFDLSMRMRSHRTVTARPMRHEP